MLNASSNGTSLIANTPLSPAIPASEARGATPESADSFLVLLSRKDSRQRSRGQRMMKPGYSHTAELRNA